MEHIDDLINNLAINNDLKEKFKICNVIWTHKDKNGKIKFRFKGSPNFRKLKLMERHSLLFPTYQPKLILLGPIAFFINDLASLGTLYILLIFYIYFNRPDYTLLIIPITWLLVGIIAASSVTKSCFKKAVLKNPDIKAKILAKKVDTTPKQEFINETLAKYKNKRFHSLLLAEFMVLLALFLGFVCPKIIQHNIGSIGCRLQKTQDHYVKIISLKENFPAKLSGLQINDKIISVNEQSTKNKSINKIISEIKGQPNTYVSLSIIRVNKKLDFNIRRIN